MSISEYLCTDKAIFIFPRRCKLEKNYELWQYNEVYKEKEYCTNVIFEKKLNEEYIIHIITENPDIKNSQTHIEKIENLVHDISKKRTFKFYIVDNIWSDEEQEIENRIIAGIYD